MVSLGATSCVRKVGPRLRVCCGSGDRVHSEG